MKKNNKDVAYNNGITLVALVITIIVLLILAGISIASLTGENGILNKATMSKEDTQRQTAKEKVQLAIMGSYGTNGKLDYTELKTNLDKVEGIRDVPNNITDESFTLTVFVDNYKVQIEFDGKVTIENKTTPPQLLQLEEAIETGNVLNENKSTPVQDKYGNIITVPEGFKIASDSAKDVTGGVVIEDVNHGATAGSQFVWIPVGEIKSANEITNTIQLNRYTYAQNGTPTAEGENIINTHYQELETSDKGNITAKNLEEFKTSVEKNGGYYIGRYEARTKNERTVATNDDGLEQITENADEYLYNFVTQPQAAKLCREMYTEDKKFTSDLTNSYAWYTAIVFIQTFDNRNNQTTPYSLQNSLNTTFEKKGTNHLEDITKQDKVCNIWDIASSVHEWTTETCLVNGSPCAFIGGSYSNSSWCSHSIGGYPISYAYSYLSFRPILYL